ncbi:MAG: VanZ family protein [Blautia obeum]
MLLFILYVLLLVYFLFFSEEYGRVTAEERVYRYNLVPFVEIRRFWIYRKQLGMFALITNLFWKCDRLYSIWFYPSGHCA